MADAINGVGLSDSFDPLSAYDEYGRRVKPPKYTRAEMNAMAEAARKADPNVVRGAIYDAVKGMGGDAGAASLASTVGSFMPVVGDLQDAEDSARAFKSGDYLTGALLAGALLAPGAAGSLVKGGKKAAKGAAKGAAKTVAKEAAQETGERAARNAMADALDTSYRGNHLAPLRNDYNAPLHALDQIYPDDIYSGNASRYYGHGDAPLDNETVRILQAARGNPDAEISVFRAVPKGVKEINPGDWVTPNRTYAMQHGGAWVDDGAYDILEKKVRAGDLFTDGNSIHEFGYSPEIPQDALQPKGIRAYHGSPHDFDRFDMSKIGTGEGAQAYGHGLYFADSEDVARGYRDALAQAPMVDGKTTWAREMSDQATAMIDAAVSNGGRTVDDAIALAQSKIDELGSLLPKDTLQGHYDLIDELSAYKGKSISNGRMYEVNINANPDDFIDFDKPFEQQPEKVRRHFAHLTKTGKGPDGSDLARRTESRVFADEASQAGIPGVKYLDGMSRSAGEGSRNYVVFDDALIEIVRKYGIAAAVGAGIISEEMARQMQAQGDI